MRMNPIKEHADQAVVVSSSRATPSYRAFFGQFLSEEKTNKKVDVGLLLGCVHWTTSCQKPSLWNKKNHYITIILKNYVK